MKLFTEEKLNKIMKIREHQASFSVSREEIASPVVINIPIVIDRNNNVFSGFSEELIGADSPIKEITKVDITNQRVLSFDDETNMYIRKG